MNGLCQKKNARLPFPTSPQVDAAVGLATKLYSSSAKELSDQVSKRGFAREGGARAGGGGVQSKKREREREREASEKRWVPLKEKPLALSLPASSASLSVFASWGARRREHAPSQREQERARGEGAHSQQLSLPLLFLPLCCFSVSLCLDFVPRAAGSAPPPRAPGPLSARSLAAGSERATRSRLRLGRITESKTARRRERGGRAR